MRHTVIGLLAIGALVACGCNLKVDVLPDKTKSSGVAPYHLTGIVTDCKTGRAVPDVTVSVQAYGGSGMFSSFREWAGNAVTDESGRFELAPALFGSLSGYDLRYARDGYAPSYTNLRADDINLSKATSFDLPAELARLGYLKVVFTNKNFADSNDVLTLGTTNFSSTCGSGFSEKLAEFPVMASDPWYGYRGLIRNGFCTAAVIGDDTAKIQFSTYRRGTRSEQRAIPVFCKRDDTTVYYLEY